ncbi:MAG: prephenate dehydratase [Deltaproteobacteria bacterium]|nr:prephenate dehydratase [Deltaproteobacteria bacterium]
MTEEYVPSDSGRSHEPEDSAPSLSRAPSNDASPGVETSPPSTRLGELRQVIDLIDQRLVALLNERARVVQEIGRLKRDATIPIYAPHREAEVLKRVLAANTGPLSDRAIEGVYRELMSGSFALEQPLRVGYLGPPGSFSHVCSVAQFGSSVAFEGLADIEAVFREVERGQLDYGLVPIENSTGGGIVDTLDAFFSVRGSLSVYAEVLVSVRHNLLANIAPERIREIYSKPEVLGQCRRWLSAHFPTANLVSTSSSSHAVVLAKEASDRDPDAPVAAIGSELAGQLYGLNVVFRGIEDHPNNITRFFVLARQRAERSGDDKTSMMFTTKDEPGALLRVLKAFDLAGINLTHIDKRPSGRENWTYTFFIDAEGHRDEEPMQRAIEAAGQDCQHFAVLGSYPRATRIL